MYEMAERLAKLLTDAGVYDKVSVYETSAECVMLTARKEDRLHLIALAEHDGWVYAKIAPADALPGASWSCNNVFYTPYGLYAFARSVEELAEKIAAKQARLRAQERILEEALRQGISLE